MSKNAKQFLFERLQNTRWIHCDIAAIRFVENAEQIERSIRLSGGSAGQALALNDEEFWKLRNGLLDGLLGTRPHFGQLVDAWKNYYEGGGKETRWHRLRVSLVLRFLVEALQQALRMTHGADVAGLDASEAARLRAFADRLGPDRLLELIDKCVEADYFVERRVQIILLVESVVERFLNG